MTHNKIAVFGSAFNPPHMGHADVIDQALAHFDQVILIPSFAHAFGKTMAPYPQRVAMAQDLVKVCGWGSRTSVSNIEEAIAASKPDGEAIYTFDVLSALQAANPECKLTFIVGPDNAEQATWEKFYKVNEVDKRWGRWVAKERKTIRSTTIREDLSHNRKVDSNICPESILNTYQHAIK